VSATRTVRIDQLLPAAHVGDATGDSARYLAGCLRRAGFEANLYGLTVDSALRGVVRSIDEFSLPSRRDLTLLHFALPSSLSDLLIRCPGRRALVYHNLTPPQMLAPYCPDIARLTAIGRDQLRDLAASGLVDLAIGVSRFNCADLEATGFTRTATLPLPMDLSRYDRPADPILKQRLSTAPSTFLTVGRIAPNKRLEDFLRVAAYYLRYVEPNARFIVIGTNRGLEPYSDALTHLHRELGLDERVAFVGRVPHEDLIAWYRTARVYVCTSAHEGFCAPLLEAMHFGLPILARDEAAIPETLGGAGVLYADPDPAVVAEALHLLATDEALRSDLRLRARQRLDDMDPATIGSRWVERLQGLLEP